MEHVAMRQQSIYRVRIATIAIAIASLSVSAFGQTGHSTLTAALQAQAAHAQPTNVVRPLSIEEAVKLALEQNLGIQIQRIDPQIQDVGVAQARSFWAPNLTSNLSRNSSVTPSANVLSGGARVDNGVLTSGVGMNQTTPWGAQYSATWNNARK